MLNPLKRKNDDKSKHRPQSLRARVLQAVVVALVLVSGPALWIAFRPAPVAYPHFPSSLLTYHSDDVRYTVDLQTGERTRINRTLPAVKGGAWSPDEKWMAYWEPTGDTMWELIVSEFQNIGTAHSLGKFRLPVSALSWSADSNFLVFSAQYDFTRPEFCTCDGEIFIISRETGEYKRLTVNANFEADPMFSPDGTQIVYTSALDNYNRLYIMDVATETWRVLTPDLYADSPVWSPDGQWIAFVSTSYDSSGDIWIIRPDGTDAQPVITGPSREHYPAWKSGRKMPYQA